MCNPAEFGQVWEGAIKQRAHATARAGLLLAVNEVA
jgi:hypothetical protein